MKAQCPGCKTSTTNITIPDLVAGKVPSTLVSALRSNPDANYLVFDDGPFADGITSALSGAGLNGKVKVIGEAADQAGIAALKTGQEAAWTGFDPGYQAYEDMDIAFRDAEGMTDPARPGGAAADSAPDQGHDRLDHQLERSDRRPGSVPEALASEPVSESRR